DPRNDSGGRGQIPGRGGAARQERRHVGLVDHRLVVRILIIDDDEDLRTLLAHYIKANWNDAQVDEFDPIEQDFPKEEFPLGDYDVIILDYMLGRGDGLDWLQRFKQRADCPKIL